MIFCDVCAVFLQKMAKRERKEGVVTSKIKPEYRVGMLTAKRKTQQRKNGYIVWECRCDCGREVFLDSRRLQRGNVRDCGCMSVVGSGRRDISGRRFGRLTALSPTAERSGRGCVIWRCRCDCGKEVCADLNQLMSGNKKSCGCLKKPPLKDYVGKRFGRLTVTGYAGKENGMHQWKCICDCGKETVAGQTCLQRGTIKSCGCLKASVYRENLGLCDGTAIAMLKASKKGRLIKTNTSGYNGVYFDKRRELWVAQITFKGKTKYLGAYGKQEEAVKARNRGEEIYDAFLEQVEET